MATNEELVAAIQVGEREKLTDLWSAVERLVWKMANRRTVTVAVDREDLVQSGYLALVAAVDTYDPTNGAKFSTWLCQHLLTAFRDARNYRTNRERRDPMHHADSLDSPLSDEENADCLSALIADPTGTAGLEDVETHIWQEQLHAALEDALAALPLEQSDTLRRRYYQNQTVRSIAEMTGTTAAEVRKAETNGLRTLRSSRVSRQLQAFIEEQTPYYLHVGVDAFQRTGESAVERIVAIREGLEKYRKV